MDGNDDDEVLLVGYGKGVAFGLKAELDDTDMHCEIPQVRWQLDPNRMS